MATVADILNYLETIAPQSQKMEWDNVGLLCGRSDKEVHRVLIALDPFLHVAEEAAQIGADLLLTHHPLIFQPISSVTDQTVIGKTLQLLIREDIAACNAHTNLDVAPNGVNQVLAELLGLRSISVIDPMEDAAFGLLRCGEVPQQSLEAFLSHVKKTLHTPVLRYADGGKAVHRVAVGGGACASEMESVLRAGCDTFLTSDVKYNGFWDAHDQGLNLIDAGHFYTENPVCAFLMTSLAQAFPDLDIRISMTHRDCMQFF